MNLDINNNEYDCSICFEKIENTINKCITECNHTFHTNCLLKALSFTGFHCPICRKTFDNNTNTNLVQTHTLTNYNIVGYDEAYYSDSDTNLSDDNEQYEFISSEVYDSNSSVNIQLQNSSRFVPSIHYITQKLVNQSYPLENFICLALMEHDEYSDEQSNFVSSNADLYNTIKDIINEYRLEQQNSIF
jgi:hypothetical protein